MKLLFNLLVSCEKTFGIFCIQYYPLLELFVTTPVSWYCCFCTSDHSTVFTFTILCRSRVLLLLLFCVIPPLPPVLPVPRHLHLHLDLLLSSLMETPSPRWAVEGPSIQLYLHSLTRAWILLKVGDNDPVCLLYYNYLIVYCFC